MQAARVVISYHYPCPDGIFAALAAHIYHAQHKHPVRWVPNTVYKPCSVQQMNLQKDEHLFMLDYIGPPGFAAEAAKHCGRVIVLDHHKTAAESLADRQQLPHNMDIVLDMKRSGAVIARDYFKPQLTAEQDEMFAYIQDADLWQWQLPSTKQFHAGLAEIGLEYDCNKNPQIFQQLLQLTVASTIERGQQALAEQQKLVAAVLEMAFPIALGGHDASDTQPGWGRCLAVQVSQAVAKHRSALGNALAEKSRQTGLRACGAVVYREPDMAPDMAKVSLRSLGREDTTAVSQAFGGGGHRNASSCIISQADFDRWRCQ
eukprot:jgi/Astpho2/5881/fgenesh1_pm.00080_%23_13_t